MRTSFSKATAASLLGLAVLAACSSAPQPKFQQEQFDTGASPFAPTTPAKPRAARC